MSHRSRDQEKRYRCSRSGLLPNALRQVQEHRRGLGSQPTAVVKQKLDQSMSEESPLPNRRGPARARQSFIVGLSFLSVTLISLVVPASAWAKGSSPHVTSA